MCCIDLSRGIELLVETVLASRVDLVYSFVAVCLDSNVACVCFIVCRFGVRLFWLLFTYGLLLVGGLLLFYCCNFGWVLCYKFVLVGLLICWLAVFALFWFA